MPKLLADDLTLRCVLSGALLDMLVPEIIPDDHNYGDGEDN